MIFVHHFFSFFSKIDVKNNTKMFPIKKILRGEKILSRLMIRMMICSLWAQSQSIGPVFFVESILMKSLNFIIQMPQLAQNRDSDSFIEKRFRLKFKSNSDTLLDCHIVDSLSLFQNYAQIMKLEILIKKKRKNSLHNNSIRFHFLSLSILLLKFSIFCDFDPNDCIRKREKIDSI